MNICAICYHEARSFGFIKPPLRASDAKNHKKIRYFCSYKCQKLFGNLFLANNMIDITKLERDAIESALKPVGELVAEIGMEKPLANYSREEVLCLIEVAVTAFQEFMQSKESDFSLEMPC